MKNIRTHIRGGRKFEIVKEKVNGEYMYMAIEAKYIDENGRLKKALNGLQMHANKSIEGCTESVNNMVDFEACKARGMSDAEAFAETFRLPLDVCKKMYA